MKTHRFLDKDGNFDYGLYTKVQTEGNKNKIQQQWVDENTVAFLARYIKSRIASPSFGICHGTRRGNEQAWFSKHLDGAKVIGTEISDTATQFPNTVQWDFHEVNPEWAGSADFVYSNSWDHSYDPKKMFSAWIEQLKPGGLLILEHSSYHRDVSELDPFGAEIEELTELLDMLAPGRFKTDAVLTDAPGIKATKTRTVPTQYIVGVKS